MTDNTIHRIALKTIAHRLTDPERWVDMHASWAEPHPVEIDALTAEIDRLTKPMRDAVRKPADR